MKPKILFYCLFLFSFSTFAQTNPISNPKNINKVDEAAIQKEVKTKVSQITSESQKIIKASELAQKKNNENLNTKIASEIVKKSKIKRIDPERIINPNQPVVSEVYYPDPIGVKPNGQFVLWGSNLQTNTGIAEVTVVIGSKTLTCKPMPSLCSADRLQLVMPDFSGISEPVNVTLTVNNDGLKSDPVSVKVTPEIVSTSLDFSLFMNQLSHDNQHSSPILKANNTNEGKHIFLIDGNTILSVYHSCKLNNENAATEYTGTDEWFSTTQLKNNWVVKQVVFYDMVNKCGTVATGQTSANLSTYHPNSPSLHTRISWYNNINMCFQSMYMVTYIIEGPKGTNYW